MSADLTISTIDPADVGARELLAQWVRVKTVSGRHDLGPLASPFSLEEYVAYASDPALRKVPHAALSGGEVVGAAYVALPQRENLHAAFLGVDVLPGRRRAGVGSALLAAVESCALGQARTSLVVQTGWPADGADTAGERFLAPHGYASALTMEQNDLDLTALRTDEPRPDEPAGPAPGESGDAGRVPLPDDYTVEVAWGMLPDSWLADRAVLAERMSTDAPQEGLDLGAESWDAGRVRQSIRSHLDSGRRRVEAVARHTSSGRLVGYTYLEVSASTPELAYQEDTLVMREHRGHGLGLRMKQAAAAALRAELPDVRRVRTWNAVSNGPMIRVNRALGFRTVAFEREWQKRL